MAAEYVELLTNELSKSRKFYENVIRDLRDGYAERERELEGKKSASPSKRSEGRITTALRGQLRALKAKER